LDLEINMTQWVTGTGEQHVPRSICSDDCPLGQIRNFQVSLWRGLGEVLHLAPPPRRRPTAAPPPHRHPTTGNSWSWRELMTCSAQLVCGFFSCRGKLIASEFSSGPSYIDDGVQLEQDSEITLGADPLGRYSFLTFHLEFLSLNYIAASRKLSPAKANIVPRPNVENNEASHKLCSSILAMCFSKLLVLCFYDSFFSSSLLFFAPSNFLLPRTHKYPLEFLEQLI
jgi:hypothetical protein